MPNRDDYSPERLADRAQITDVLHRYCRGVDRMDFDLLRTVYHPDAIDEHGIYVGGPDGMLDWIKERHKGVSFSAHMVMNITIEFAGPDTAIVESYYIVAQHYPAEKSTASKVSMGNGIQPGTATNMHGYGRYIDKFTRRDGEWRVEHRWCASDYLQVTPSTVPQPPMAPATILGTHDMTDPLYAVRKSVGLS